MQFVNEQDNVLRAANFVHDRLDAFLELTAIFRAGNHEREVERDDTLAAQNFRHVARRDFLRETFDNGRLAHARFAKQHGIIFCATTENLDDAFNLVLAPDDRIHVAFARNFSQVTTEMP